MKEEFRVIEEFPNYSVSNLGRVRRDVGGKGAKAGHILQPAPNRKGYYKVGLFKSGSRRHRFVHRLVAVAFIPNPESLSQINHIDGRNKPCNYVSNLEWASSFDNMRHAYETGLCEDNTGERSHFAKITNEQAIEIKTALAERVLSQGEIAAKYGLSSQTVSNINTGTIWKYVGKEIDLSSSKHKRMLSVDEVREIKRLLRESFSLRKIAKMFALPDHSMVLRIKQGKCWANIH